MTQLTSDKITLRHVNLSDAQIFFDAEQDEDTKNNFMRTPTEISQVEDDIREEMSQYKKSKPTSEKFAIDYEGNCAGWVTISQLNTPFSEHKAKIDFLLHPDFRGKGIMPEAIGLVTDYAMRKYNLVRVEGWCRDFNVASARVLKKAGYKHEGTLMKNKCKNGIFLNDMVFAFVK
jgi:RimJ/RimL family protein N-acetyltransferase